MKILWMTWKDLKHPLAGGAEVVNEELAKRLAADGHEVTFLVSSFDGAATEDETNGYKVIRMGNRYSVYWKAYRYYKKHLVGWADLVIDEVNTIPFFAKFYVKEPSILFVHMLCRKIWFYEMTFPFSLVGYVAEPVYIWLLRKQKVVTVSESTKQDLLRFGFKPEQINIISEGIEMKPIEGIGDRVQGIADNPKSSSASHPKPSTLHPPLTLLSLGSIRAMKRTADQIRAFEKAKLQIKGLKLKVAGDSSGKYGQKVLRMIQGSQYAADIEYLGKVSQEQKIELLRRCHAILVSSVKEGWGLVVTEAASQGTPAVVYNVDGLRDSVQDGKTGLICSRNNPDDLADKITQLFSNNDYNAMQKKAWEWSKEITFDRSYNDFKRALELT